MKHKQILQNLLKQKPSTDKPINSNSFDFATYQISQILIFIFLKRFKSTKLCVKAIFFLLPLNYMMILKNPIYLEFTLLPIYC